MAGEIKLSGISSGIAFDEMIAKMIDAERYQANKLESWKKTWQDKVDTLRELSSRVASLQNSNNFLRNAASFVSRMATATNNNVADITVDSSAIVGSYKIEVAEAVKHKTGSTGIENPDTELLDFQTGEELAFYDGVGNLVTIDLENIKSIEDLVEAIDSQANVSAELVKTSSTSETYRIVITSSIAGTSGEIKFQKDDTGLGFGKTSISEKLEGPVEITSIFSANGDYTGHVSKRINFNVENNGKISDGNVRIRWEDSVEGRSGVITLPPSGGNITLFQGLSLNLNALGIDETLTRGTQFAMDVYAPDIQMAQNRGIAQSAQVTHAGLGGRNAFVTNVDGTFQYSYRGVESQMINVPANTTLEGLVTLINTSPGNPGVRASILNDGMGTAQSYHLVLTGIDTGAANQIEISDSTNLSNMKQEDFITTRKAQNALVKLDDFPYGNDNWIQKNSNLISDMIEGASIRLKDVGVSNVSITNNDDDMADKVQAFVDEYNALLDYIDEITKVVLDEEDKAVYGAGGILTGNYAVNMLRSSLRTMVGSRAVGFDVSNDAYSLFTQIGLTSNSNTRRLEFDREAFKNELNNNTDAVVKLFSADKAGSLDNNNFIYVSGTSDTKSGIYDFDVEFGSNNEIIRVSYKDKASGQVYTSDGNNPDIRIASNGKSFTVFAGSARGVAIQAVGGQQGTNQKVTLNVKDGKAKTFNEDLEKLFDQNSGITKVLERNYESIIKSIDKRIDRENMRIIQVKKRLEMKFANLEVNMANWNGQMERLQQQIASLPS